MKSAGEIGLKISAALREYYRYTGSSAELERRGASSSRSDRAWVQWARQQDEESFDRRGQEPGDFKRPLNPGLQKLGERRKISVRFAGFFRG
jgi:hypothetical protein